jgi:hypothetical protein
MIGVAVQSTEQETVREFFELFKTPWEFYQPVRTYDVLLCTHDECSDAKAKLKLIYRGERTSFDVAHDFKTQVGPARSSLVVDSQRLPLYGKCVTFPGKTNGELKEDTTQTPLALRYGSPTESTVRIGYDLFAEVRFLLTEGQPQENASVLACVGAGLRPAHRTLAEFYSAFGLARGGNTAVAGRIRFHSLFDARHR